MSEDVNIIKLPEDKEIQEIIEKVMNDPTLFHPYNRPFRAMNIANFKTLALDIKLNGLEHKIIKTIDRNDGIIKILDGKLRYIACIIANVVPLYEYRKELSEIQKILLVISKNLNRRHYKLHEKIKIAHFLYAEIKRLRNEKNPPDSINIKRDILPQISKKIEATQDKAIVSEIAKTLQTNNKTVEQGMKILEKSQTDLQSKNVWREIESGKKTINQGYNELAQKSKIKPIQRVTQAQINSTLREQLKKTDSQLQKKSKAKNTLEQKCSRLQLQCNTLEDKLTQIKAIVQSDISKNKMKVKILSIIDNGHIEKEIFPVIEKFGKISP